MIEIAKCESHLRQWVDGKVLAGIVNPKDRGLFQLNAFYHKEAALKMGLDIETAEGNIAYAKHLYENEGTRPWDASKKCWKPLAPN